MGLVRTEWITKETSSPAPLHPPRDTGKRTTNWASDLDLSLLLSPNECHGGHCGSCKVAPEQDDGQTCSGELHGAFGHISRAGFLWSPPHYQVIGVLAPRFDHPVEEEHLALEMFALQAPCDGDGCFPFRVSLMDVGTMFQ